MTIKYLKKSIDEKQRSEDNDKVKKIVEETLSKIQNEGDRYIRELSIKFDNYSPKSFRLSDEEIKPQLKFIGSPSSKFVIASPY